jgi:WhiB family transcriptional regulator, redox-sensing transcriptional regulator
MDANWRDDAACLHADPELFFPVSMTGPALDQVDEAKRICRTCPVCERCLAWALNVGDVSGIWGGSTEDERRALLRTASRRRHRALPKARAQVWSADA